MISVEMTVRYGVLQRGDVAGFEPEEAKQILAKGWGRIPGQAGLPPQRSRVDPDLEVFGGSDTDQDFADTVNDALDADDAERTKEADRMANGDAGEAQSEPVKPQQPAPAKAPEQPTADKMSKGNKTKRK